MHPFGDLSAYLDGALSSEARASVQAHLDTCALCRTRLADLRGTAQLIAGLPKLVPSRSLVPRVSIPFWVAPLRTISTFASGAALFVFVVSLVTASLPVGTQSAAPAAAPAPNAGGAAADKERRTVTTSATAGPQGFNAVAPSPTPAPPAPDDAAKLARSPERTDAATERRAQDSAASASPSPADTATRINFRETAPLPSAPPTWLWLVLGVGFGVLSFVLGRRLRSA